MRIVLVLSLVYLLTDQQEIDPDYASIFGQPNGTQGNFLSELGDVVTKHPLESLAAVDRCGEGADHNVHTCVPYYHCDRQTTTIITDGQSAGFGLLDIRIHQDNPCDHPLDICCRLPDSSTSQAIEPLLDPSSTSSPNRPGRRDFCGIRNPKGIDASTNGNKNEAEYGEFPWMVQILKRDDYASLDDRVAFCGGALITPIAVLTAAHCVYRYKVNEIKIRAGEWNTLTTSERLPHQERNVVEIVFHEGFREIVLHDNVALLILNDYLTKADNLGTVCLPAPGRDLNTKNCFATGWGMNTHGVRQEILKKIELPVIPRQKCQQILRTTKLGKNFRLHESFICAGGEAGKDTCSGDGGGPLVCPDASGKKYYQVGIVSWGIGCGEEKIPGVYTNVSKYFNWVNREMKKRNLITKPYLI